MVEAAKQNWLIKSHVEAADRPPETMSLEDFVELYRQRRVAFYQKRGEHTANPDYLLIQAEKKPIDAALYLGRIFAVSSEQVQDAEYTISLTGSPMQRIVIVHNHS